MVKGILVKSRMLVTCTTSNGHLTAKLMFLFSVCHLDLILIRIQKIKYFRLSELNWLLFWKIVCDKTEHEYCMKKILHFYILIYNSSSFNILPLLTLNYQINSNEKTSLTKLFVTMRSKGNIPSMQFP